MTDERPHDAPRDDDDVFVDASMAWEGDEPFLDLPGWVKPVGIISILWGALGLFCGVLGVGGSILMRQMQQSASNQMQGGFPDVYLNPPASAQAAQVAGMVWAFLLIASGAMLLARKPVARPMHLVYALGAIILTVWGIYEQLQIQIAVRQWIADNPDSDFARMSGQGGMMGAFIGIGVGVLLGMAWPIFCLVWFGLVKRKPTDITGEGDLPQPAA